jgi:hypothetical protein
MGVNTYADLLDTQIAHAVRFFLADHEAVCLYFYAKPQPARVLQDFEEVHAHQHFAAAQRKEENSGIGKLVEEILDFSKGHFPVVIVVQVAVRAPLIATIGNVQVGIQRHTQFQSLGLEFFH